ncbi:hypothetical protein BpHYR1_021567 [Brachionus plicatilis]|uniref:Uncharacterized protein n=1 Tax=Brachionus plicatilis TaxID=10195 RepID=A0A3M7S6J2_BRAPC|nr:hypothetical protein BpHYR1_021567 [Brachionus plicatilis]
MEYATHELQRGPRRPGSAGGGVTLLSRRGRTAPDVRGDLSGSLVSYVQDLSLDGRRPEAKASTLTYDSSKQIVQADTDPGVVDRVGGTSGCREGCSFR